MNYLISEKKLTFKPQTPSYQLATSLLAMVLLCTGCEQKSKQEFETPPPVSQVAEEHKSTLTTGDIGENNQANSLAIICDQWITSSFEQSLADIQRFTEASNTFYQSPSEDSLNNLKMHWQNSHESFTKTALIFSLAKASPDLFYTLDQWQSLIDAYSVQPGYLDSFDVYTHSGIVNDRLLKINGETLRHQHQLTHKDEIALGFHALEFLIWGENSHRPLSMFIADDSDDIDRPENRRRDLIRLLSRLLSDDLKKLQNHWLQSVKIQLARLNPLSQQQLWREALPEYWHEHGIEQLSLADDERHTQFAGESQAKHVAIGLSTVAEILAASKTQGGYATETTMKELDDLISQLQLVLQSEKPIKEDRKEIPVATESQEETEENTSAVNTETADKPSAVELSNKIYQRLL